MVGRLSRGRHRMGEERGAVAVMVALLMVPLLGFAAIAVDVAAVHAERQELRNGTDAAALAVAYDCARDACGNTPQTAATLVAANSGSVAATVGTPNVQVGDGAVTVTATATQNHVFAPLIGVESSTVAATSVAAWSGISHATAALPLAISLCEYDKHRSSATVTMEASNSGCTGAGQTRMRYVWLATDSGSVCRTTTAVGAQVVRSGGGSTRLPSACANQAQHLLELAGQTVLLPVLEAGSADRVYGFAAFHVTGYSNGTKAWADMNWLERFFAIIAWLLDMDTGGKGLLVQGSFTTHVELSDAPVITTSSAPDLGARSVYLTERNPQ